MNGRHKWRLWVILSYGLIALAAKPLWAQDTLTIASNGGSIADAQRMAFVEPFTKATGVRVVEDVFNQELAKIRTQVETKNIQWDVVSVTAINEATACDEGLLEPIDWSKHLDAKLFAGVGGFGKCGVPHNFVSGGLAYDGDKITDPPKSWSDFWDIKKYPGKRGLLYRAEQTFEVALMADGVEPKDAMAVLSAPGGVERAFKKLAEIKPHVLWWKSGDESMRLLLSGDVVMTYAWNGRVAAANKANNRHLKILFGPGHVSGSQIYAIMKGTPKKELAIKYIVFASQPGPQAEFARIINYAPANEAAYGLMSAADRATLPQDHLDRASLQAGSLYFNFWLDKGDAVLQQFIKFAAQ
jgi:putative spermidine/putrescine transport system substrate-binding protein